MSHKQLVGYITAAYPDVNFSIDLILSMQESGLDKIEIGLPFSDPVADGPVIEAANLKALDAGWRLNDGFELSKQIAPKIDSYFMGYFNQFFHYGLDKFLTQTQSHGLKGLIIPDLPYEQAQVFKPQFDAHQQTLIDFVAPTDTKERIDHLLKGSSDWIYLVAYAGITGSGASEDLTKVIADIKSVTDTPVFVGFGVNEQTAQEKAQGVDGVIVGSVFIKILADDGLTKTQKIDKISSLTRVIKEKINS
jgi:tryptophan synthase alpha chain